MILPTKADIRRAVTYREAASGGHIMERRGIVSSFNDWFVFVSFDDAISARATPCAFNTLDWAGPRVVPAPERLVCRD